MFTRLTKAEETDPGSSQRRPSRAIRRTTARPSWAWVTSITHAEMMTRRKKERKIWYTADEEDFGSSKPPHSVPAKDEYSEP